MGEYSRKTDRPRPMLVKHEFMVLAKSVKMVKLAE